jgi:hypothetical protein
MTRYPSQLFLEIKPDARGPGGTAKLLAREWVLCPPETLADCRILPVSGEVKVDADGLITVQIKLRAVGKETPPPDPPLIVLP